MTNIFFGFLARVPDNQYFGQEYYVPKTTPNSWLMKFLVGKDLETLKKVKYTTNTQPFYCIT